MRKRLATFLWLAATALALPALPACTATEDGDGEDDSFASGKADGSIPADGTPEALAVLALVNDTQVTATELKNEARVTSTAAKNIVKRRDGSDGQAGTGDDNAFDDLAELDAVKFVGPVTFERLLAYAIAQGYLDAQGSRDAAVIFSPQLFPQSHNARVAELIDGAQHSIDIAMYSYSDAGIGAALDRAVDRGVKVRFLFDTAAEDRKLTGDALKNSKSGKLEQMGVNVRWVNKILHHKLAIIDGPRDDASRAATARIVTGSGNWSNGAATKYDENTLFMTGHTELTLGLQREFNLLWDHSRDLVAVSLPFEKSTFVIDDSDIADDPGLEVNLTSANFTVSGDTFRTVRGSNAVSDVLVAGIESAERSIHIASGHLRSRPISEALMARAAADPDLDIRVYLDGQEYISEFTHFQQLDDLEECQSEATSESTRLACLDSSFLFGFQVGDTEGISVRYKYYAYRWDAGYAAQMHHKYMIVDGTDLFTGSYNLSDNAEHNTFENMLVFRGPAFASLVARYEDNFGKIWETGRSQGLLATLTNQVKTANPVPLVFPSMALTWAEVTELKDLIKDNCDDINTEPFRTDPTQHQVCPR